nr:alpha/beta fold hydrolase [Rhabdothermincola salaria]
MDTGPGPKGTIVCVHGNPTWGYLWRDVLRRLSPDWRVVAVDQTNMGWSERTGPRSMAERVDELVAFCRQEVSGPLVLMAHDWGGPIAVGASAELTVQAVVLANTAVAKPEGVAVPPLIATARRMVDLACRRTPLFVAGTAAMTAAEHRAALRAPYGAADRREAVARFVADIPLDPSDPSWAALGRSADALAALDVPLLLVWGGRDPVFHDRFLADLLERAPHADVHRFPRAGHLVPLDEPIGEVAAAWLDGVLAEPPDLDSAETDAVATDAPSAGPTAAPDEARFRAVTAALGERADHTSAAYTGPDGSVTWAELAARSDMVARRLLGAGLAQGDRVALLVPPSGDMLVVAYGIWKAGGVLVVADAGLGPKGLRHALRGATPSWVVGTRRTLVAARLLGLTPGARRASLDRVPGALALAAPLLGAPAPLPALGPDDVAAVVHTSGATGPAKPVRYRHGALAHQRDVVASSFAMTGDEAFTTSFAPFVLLGPALGVPCVLPDIDVTRPGDLDLDRLVAACEGHDVGVAWLSPASARRIVATAEGRRAPLRLVMLAGAPIDADLARGITAVTGADVRAPYGMTEAMPVTDGTDATRPGPLGGTATGWPLVGAEVLVVPLDDPDGEALPAGQWGELLVSAPWMRDGYDRRWRTDTDATVHRQGRRFHRTGDVGYADDEGRLFQLGRLAHVVWSDPEPLASVAVEQPIAEALGRPVAAVGVGPVGNQVLVVVVDQPGRLGLADATTTDAVRAAAAHPVAAVLAGPLPVDVRHRSKVDRAALAAAADALLAGR